MYPSKEDRGFALDSIKYILKIIKTNPLVFDSIALNLQSRKDNSSAVFDWKYNSDIPKEHLSLMDSVLPGGFLREPFEVDGGYLLIMVHEKESSVFPTLENSWGLIYSFALQRKISITMERWLNVIKNSTYIKYYD